MNRFIQRVKYVLFDFSENFKDDFLNTLGKSVVFIIGTVVFGIISAILGGSNEIVYGIAAVCAIITGILWGRSFSSVFSLGDAIRSIFSNNVIMQWFALILSYVAIFLLGWVYFLWCVIKFVICLIKK